jgi:hypothetical protein
MKTARKPARRGLRTTKSGLKPLGKVSEKVSETASYEVRAQLRELLEGSNIPASARVTAARTLAEIEGLIGRHQAAPVQLASPVHALSRDELVTELERLRTLHGLGLIV